MCWVCGIHHAPGHVKRAYPEYGRPAPSPSVHNRTRRTSTSRSTHPSSVRGLHLRVTGGLTFGDCQCVTVAVCVRARACVRASVRASLSVRARVPCAARSPASPARAAAVRRLLARGRRGHCCERLHAHDAARAQGGAADALRAVGYPPAISDDARTRSYWAELRLLRLLQPWIATTAQTAGRVDAVRPHRVPLSGTRRPPGGRRPAWPCAARATCGSATPHAPTVARKNKSKSNTIITRTAAVAARGADVAGASRR
jgi:hypothetical protein